MSIHAKMLMGGKRRLMNPTRILIGCSETFPRAIFMHSYRCPMLDRGSTCMHVYGTKTRNIYVINSVSNDAYCHIQRDSHIFSALKVS